MFGYIHANRQEMSEPDQKTYKTYYCGLCQALKRAAGMKGQILLNYDVTFLCILLSSLYEIENKEEVFGCKVHPLSKKCGYISPVIDYGAAMNILLGYHNLMDDYLDNGNRKKKSLPRARAAVPWLRGVASRHLLHEHGRAVRRAEPEGVRLLPQVA